MKFINYLEELITNPEVIEKFILPTFKNKSTFWIPLKGKYTSSLQPKKIKFYKLGTRNPNNFLNINDNPWIALRSNYISSRPVKRLKAFHQLGIKSVNKFLNIKRNVSISTFTNIGSDAYGKSGIDKIFKESIGSAGFGLVAVVEGTPLIKAPKDIKTRRDENRRWVNLDGNIGISHYQKIKDQVVQKIKDYLNGKEILSLNQKEKNKLISFYYKTIWETLKEKNSNNVNFYKHLSFGELKKIFTSKSNIFKGNASNLMSYNEIIMNNIKIKKIYYSKDVADQINTGNPLFVPFEENSFQADLIEISNQE